MEDHNPVPENKDSQSIDSEKLNAEHSKQFARSQIDRVFLGVCGGIAHYLDIDPLILRLIFVFSVLIGGWGAVVYIVAAMMIPLETSTSKLSSEETARLKQANTKTLTGTAFILIGFFFIFDFFGIIEYFSVLGIPPELFWPVSFVVFGIYFLRQQPGSLHSSDSQKKLNRSKSSGRFMGVCSGLAKYLNADSNLIRMIWILFTFISLGLGVVIYFLIVLMVPYYNEG